MENDLIHRSTALAILRDLKEAVGNYAPVDDIDDAIDMVKGLKAVDAAEVVRCKDCLNCGMKASIKYDGYRDDARLCMVQYAVVLPDDYCSRGEKMAAEVTDEQ